MTWVGGDLPLYYYVQAFPRVLIENVQYPEGPAVVRPFRHDIVTPYAILMRWSEPDTRTIVQPQSPSFRLLLRHLQSLVPPDPLYPLVVHLPAFVMQKTGDPPVPIASVLGGQPHDPVCELILLVRNSHAVPLRRTVLSQSPACPSFGYVKRRAHRDDRLPPFRRAQKFPRDTSLRTALSKERSATSFLSLTFSFSSSLNRFA